MEPSRLQFVLFETMTIAVVIAFFVFWWHEKLPSVETFSKIVDMMNTKGGNIIILAVFSTFGIFVSVRMLYYLVQLSVDGKLQADNSFALLAVSFMTNTITGGFIGALLKTMSGEAQTPQPQPPAPEVKP